MQYNENSTLQRVKCTDDFPFPLVLDMEPYLLENLSEQTTRTTDDEKHVEKEYKAAEAEKARREGLKKKVWVFVFLLCQ